MSTIRFAALCTFLGVCSSSATARMNEADLEKYFSKEHSFVFVGRTPAQREEWIEQAMKNRGLGFFLPADESVAKKAITDDIHIEQLLYDRVFKKTKPTKADLELLKEVYARKDYSIFLRWPAALLLYIETDDTGYIEEMMTRVSRPTAQRTICPTYIKMYAEVHDDKYYLILTDLVLNGTREILFAKASGSGYEFGGSRPTYVRDYLTVILCNYVELCISVYEQKLPSDYRDWLFRNYFTMRRYATGRESPLEIAEKLCAYSTQACKDFLSASVETNDHEAVETLGSGNAKVVDLLIAVCNEKAALSGAEKEKYAQLSKMLQESKQD